MKISVLGCGRWGSFLAWYSAKLGHKVIIWGREESNTRKNLSKNRKNEYLKLPDSIPVESSLEMALSSDIVLIAVGSQGLRDLCKDLTYYHIHNKIFILCMKGLEEKTGKCLTQIFREEISQSVDLAIWVGPGHPQEFIKNTPSCMVISSDKPDITRQIVATFKSDLIRFYYSQDVTGNEIGAASKNVMGIAAGMLDGLGLSSLKGPLMARGPREISRLVKVMGGNELTVYGLCHIGDYAATLFSDYSRNRRFGEDFVNGKRFDELAEGVSTTSALRALSKQYNLELPICEAVYNIIKRVQEPRRVLKELFFRPIKYEF